MSLNPAQREAVEHGDGPLLILAGAGSGKTRVITHRIARLLERGVAAESIVAVSFTNKAAGEMAERMAALVGRRRAGALRLSTFHRLGLRMLREGRRGEAFVIFDQADAVGLVREILRGYYRGSAARRFEPGSVLSRISNWKSGLVAPDEVRIGSDPYDEIAARVYPEYDARLEAMRAWDFDDLVSRPVRMLRDDPALRRTWQGRISHLLVDEFQDTSAVQLELVKQLANERRNVCVVGDDDQSIYGWRGADVGNILQFERHFPGARVVRLETNYRSSAAILEVANAVIGQTSARRHAKRLRPARDGGEAVRRCGVEDADAEARFVAAEIRELNGEGRRPYESMAVLYRSNAQSRRLEQELAERDIPYRVRGGQPFLDRKEVKDFAAYLRVVVQPRDEISLRRVLNWPTRGIGTRSVARIEAHARAAGIPFTRACEMPDAIDGLPDGARAGLRKLQALLAATRRRMEDDGALHGAARDLVEAIELRRVLDESGEGGNDGDARFRNVGALIAWLERYEAGGERSRRSLQDFLQRTALDTDPADGRADARGVTLSTLHAAKGLEFPVVFIVGCVEGRLPHSRTTDPRANEAAPADLEEERRLFYVGVTRARDRLYLTVPRQGSVRGRGVDLVPSRFLDGLPEERVEPYEREEQRDLSAGEVSSLIQAFLAGRGGNAPTV